ncbi:Phosphodiesterase YfcE [Caloramator mitchellensis]|uniref:Phosphoesterase n=1 Tax=Caloramator mitchellensis TaxID=908809 RepID=A0A0R3JUV9_CALMK|nr:phosphodiesterase [Caloramator mitchellensis]KRQ87353.1 Phosphodiesterase YfcE [Caloramator mitchellensis]
MKIGFISDIHGYPEKFNMALKYLKDADAILCAGDILYHGPRNPIMEGYNPLPLADEIKNTKILIAKGNCDAEVDEMVLGFSLMPVIYYEKDGIRIITLHGHNHDEAGLENLAKSYNANLVVTGHTHVRKFEKINGITYINPGSVSIPKGDGQPSIAIYEDGQINFINIENGQIIESHRI